MLVLVVLHTVRKFSTCSVAESLLYLAMYLEIKRKRYTEYSDNHFLITYFAKLY